MAARDRSPAPSAGSWREPTSLLPLRWGWYRERLLLGAVLIVGGGVAIAGSNTWSLWLLALGTGAYLAGWSILPSAGWRRVVVLFPVTTAAWLLLTGPRFIGVIVIPFLAWLLVRHRPPRSYPTVLFVIATAIVIGRVFVTPEGLSQYEYMSLALGIAIAVIVLSAWAARLLHAAGPARAAAPTSANPQRPGADPS